jgi:predicted TPR repeat methyltransferase
MTESDPNSTQVGTRALVREQMRAERLKAAMEAHRSGRLVEAEVAYRRVLRQQQDDPEALKLLGILSWHKRDPLTAEKLLRRSVEVNRNDSETWLNLGNLLVAKGDLREARVAFSAATEVAPHLDLAWLNLGVCLRKLDLPVDAAAALRRALDLNPRYEAAYNSLVSLLNRAGKFTEPAAVYRTWHAHDPSNPVPKHMLAATAGNPPDRAPDEYVQRVFDRLAPDFDKRLLGLGYRGPELVAECLARYIRPDVRLDVLDAGCGTGLCGPLLRGLARSLVGVDLSSKMIQQAHARGSYDELVVEELSEFMRGRRGAFDAVACVDTFIYFGSIDEPLGAARTCLRSGGFIAFTAERLSGASSYCLEPHGRYSHSESYVREALRQAGFTGVRVDTVALRRERGDEVRGIVVLARVP